MMQTKNTISVESPQEAARPTLVNFFWFRRDLRLTDNTGLYHALRSGLPVVALFIFDKNILDELEEKDDRRVGFIYRSLQALTGELNRHGAAMEIRYGHPLEIFEQLTVEYSIHTFFTNHDYEPYATKRDSAVREFLKEKNIGFSSFKDHVIFEKNEAVKNDGGPYTVFTPFSKKWLSLLQEDSLRSLPSEKYLSAFYQQEQGSVPAMAQMGFIENGQAQEEREIDHVLLEHYHLTRDVPSLQGTSRLGVHLRFGTISIRHLVKKALELNRVFLNELIWREFFMQLLWHFPRLVNEACKPEYESIKWRNHQKEFELWCEGKTGYPIVDAGMRELNATGFMHNRVRMITASFLVKHLLIDWRWGEAYFAQKLMDYELASNNGNWQWVAGCGCDAAPYFRIFNPHTQTKRFDPDLKYIRKWVPELESFSYPNPVVDHETARERCLSAYKKALAASRH